MPVTVQSLHIYPVKGMKGIELAHARATERGLEHDRRWMVVDLAGEFFTQRSHPKLATVWTELVAGALELSAPDVGSVVAPLVPESTVPTRVRVWNSICDALPVSPRVDAWLSEYMGESCRLVYMPESTRRASNPAYAGDGERLVGFADGYAYLVANSASLEDLNKRLAARGHPPLPMNRFRPNIVVAGAAPYEEDGWVELRVGEAVLRSAKPCGRCEVTTTDQTTGERRGPEPLATLATYRSSDEFGVMFGLNLVTLTPGVVRRSDRVEPQLEDLRLEGVTPSVPRLSG
jgi:uncharacterized protein YcbX